MSATRVNRQPLYTFAGHSVHVLTAGDGEDLQAIFESDPEYFERTFGLPPGPAEAQSTFTALPEGKTYSDKLLLGVTAQAPAALVGVVDAIRDYPSPGIWTLGLLFIAPTARRKGVATRVLRGFIEWGASRGARQFRAVVPIENKSSQRLLERVGFSMVRHLENFVFGSRTTGALLFAYVVAVTPPHPPG